LAFAHVYIGDSQTMAAECAVLGTPFIRVNDFVGKLGYLNELENKYELGFGIKPREIDTIFPLVEKLLKEPELREKWATKREIMLNEKIDFAEYLSSFIEITMNNKK
jgi:uncharacterized protein